MSDSTIYNVTCPRKYKTRAGEEKTHFWQVGVAFPMSERDGFRIELWTRVLPTDTLLLFAREQRPGAARVREDEPPPTDDDIPF